MNHPQSGMSHPKTGAQTTLYASADLDEINMRWDKENQEDIIDSSPL